MSFRIAGILYGIRICHLPNTGLQSSSDKERYGVICNNRFVKVGATM